MKKVVSLLLASALAVSMTTVGFAATAAKYDGFATNMGLLDLAEGSSDVDLGDLNPGTAPTLTIPLTRSLFTLESGTPAASGGVTTTLLSKDEIKKSKFTVKLKASKGSQVIDEYKIDGSNIKVTFVDPFKSNNDDGVDFAFKVYLVIDGKNYSDDDESVLYEGNFANILDDDYDADTDWYDFSDGNILEPSEYIKSFEGDLGEGVSVFMRGLKGQHYWGNAKTDTTDADDANIVKYNLDGVYHIDQVGIANVADHVMLNDVAPDAYVYDADMKYLGRGKEKLAFSETYYLSSKELDVDSTEVEPEEEGEAEGGDGYEVPEETGGDTEYPTNVNDNPGTGK